MGDSDSNGFHFRSHRSDQTILPGVVITGSCSTGRVNYSVRDSITIASNGVTDPWVTSFYVDSTTGDIVFSPS